MEIYISVWLNSDSTYRVHRFMGCYHQLVDSVFIVRETPWPRKDGNLLW